MGVYSIIEEVAAQFTANFATQLAAVGTEQSVALNTGFTLFKRQRAENSWERDTATLSLWVDRAMTRARNQNLRMWQVMLNIDYTFRGTDRETVATQLELGLDAAMRVIDGIPDGVGVTIIAAGEQQWSTATLTDISDALQGEAGTVAPAGPIRGGVRLTVPMIQRENLPAS